MNCPCGRVADLKPPVMFLQGLRSQISCSPLARTLSSVPATLGLNKPMTFGSPLAMKTGNAMGSEVPGEAGPSEGLRVLTSGR